MLKNVWHVYTYIYIYTYTYTCTYIYIYICIRQSMCLCIYVTHVSDVYIYATHIYISIQYAYGRYLDIYQINIFHTCMSIFRFLSLLRRNRSLRSSRFKQLWPLRFLRCSSPFFFLMWVYGPHRTREILDWDHNTLAVVMILSPISSAYWHFYPYTKRALQYTKRALQYTKRALQYTKRALQYTKRALQYTKRAL